MSYQKYKEDQLYASSVVRLAQLRAYRKRFGTDPPSFIRPETPKDPIGWASQNFYIPSTGRPIVLMPHQQAFLKLAFTRKPDGSLPYRQLTYSSIKQSGKSTIGGLILQWYAETQGRRSELYAIGNDQEQAKGRSFREVRWSLELTPGYEPQRERIPGQWDLAKTTLRCIPTGSEIRALAVDAKGEAGGKPAISCWTELWGAEYEQAKRFWEELTPIPTVPDSVRLVETYAGYIGESELLYGLYQQGKQAHQLTAGELSRRIGTPIGPPFGPFPEAKHADDPIPFYEDAPGSYLMYWDEGEVARRMPWQQGELGLQYYREQERSGLTPKAFRRLHLNEWVSPESSFIKPEWWDALIDHSIPPLLPGDRTPIVLGVDGAVSGDCFAIVAVSRHPDIHDDIAVRQCMIYDPKELGIVDFDEAERFIRYVCQGGCRNGHPRSFRYMHLNATDGEHYCEECALGEPIPGFNVVHVAYDSYQLEQMFQRLRNDEVSWIQSFPQSQDRLRADKHLYDCILRRTLHHTGDENIRQHVLNAGAKMQTDQDSTLRLVKVHAQRKIDAAVALSMAAYRCSKLAL